MYSYSLPTHGSNPHPPYSHPFKVDYIVGSYGVSVHFISADFTALLVNWQRQKRPVHFAGFRSVISCLIQVTPLVVPIWYLIFFVSLYAQDMAFIIDGFRFCFLL